MLNQGEPKEYILSSNETHSVKEFVSLAFEHAGVSGFWSGEGMDEKFKVHDEGAAVLAETIKEFYRPAEVQLLYGDSCPAREELGWKPEISFDKLVQRMVQNDLDLLNK